MGRSWEKKTTVEECRALSLVWLRKNGYLRPGVRTGIIQWKNGIGNVIGSITLQSSISIVEGQDDGFVRLSYTITNAEGIKTSLDYQVGLATTPCHYGGVRYWFVCPLARNGQSCRRRTTRLFLPGGATHFGCRVCYDLTYESCQEHDSRVDWLVRNPALLQAAMKGRGSGSMLLALKASMKLLT
jgi:hypothetical protein